MLRSGGMRTIFMAAALLVMGVLAESARAGSTDVDQTNLDFETAAVTVKAGDTIRFHNHDSVIHNINVIDSEGDPDDLGLQKPGETIAKTFDVPGEYQVRCAIHPRMKMTVNVR